MPISRDLFLAILSMDAYNRGYNAGVNLTSGSTSQIGNATVRGGTNAETEPQAVAASLYAQSYSWNGQTVISYRGTDATFADAWSGYGVAAGSPNGVQARLVHAFSAMTALCHSGAA